MNSYIRYKEILCLEGIKYRYFTIERILYNFKGGIIELSPKAHYFVAIENYDSCRIPYNVGGILLRRRLLNCKQSRIPYVGGMVIDVIDVPFIELRSGDGIYLNINSTDFYWGKK
jgi:hypothetical protein